MDGFAGPPVGRLLSRPGVAASGVISTSSITGTRAITGTGSITGTDRDLDPGGPDGADTRSPTKTSQGDPRSLLALDRSYLAVQGPPGTGKTFTGSRVDRRPRRAPRLEGRRRRAVARGRREHAARVVKAGLDPARIGKKPKRR